MIIVSLPIKPSDPLLSVEGFELNELIDFINRALLVRDWHRQISEVEGYHAILLSPYGRFESKAERVAELFREAGWDCKYSAAYDARGPHSCFYFNKKHFKDAQK